MAGTQGVLAQQADLHQSPDKEADAAITPKACEPETVVADVEGEIGELVSRDIAEPQRQPANDGEAVVSDLGLLLQRVSANSVQEIDWTINDLKILRERLQHEGERIADKIAAYASLSQTAIQTTETISARLTKMDRNS